MSTTTIELNGRLECGCRRLLPKSHTQPKKSIGPYRSEGGLQQCHRQIVKQVYLSF